MSEKKTPPHNDGAKKPDNPPKQTPPAPEHQNAKPADNKPATPPPVSNHTGKPADSKPAATTSPASSHANKPADVKPAPAPASKPPAPPVNPPTDTAKKGNGLSLLALAVSAIALALGGYQFVQNSALKSQLNEQRAVTTKEVARLDESDKQSREQIATLRSDIANIQVPSLDMDSVKQAIAANGAALEDSVNQRFATLPEPLARNDVQSLIKQELATFAQNLDGNRPALDFSDEIAKVQASENSAKQVLAQIEQQANTLDSRLKQALSEAEKHLNDVASSQSSLVNLLALAQLAGHAGQYQAAAQYLQQADKMLTGTAHADWQGALRDAAKQYLQLSAAPSPASSLEAIIDRVGEWPLRESGQSNLLQSEAAPQTATFMDKMQQIGSDILANTVTVMPLDDEGLVWINHNPALQNIIRQNVRLDLAFARNALQMQDKAAFTQITATLKGQIERYFDTSHADVAAALQTLDTLNSAQISLPDLAPMIQTLRSAP